MKQWGLLSVLLFLFYSAFTQSPNKQVFVNNMNLGGSILNIYSNSTYSYIEQDCSWSYSDSGTFVMKQDTMTLHSLFPDEPYDKYQQLNFPLLVKQDTLFVIGSPYKGDCLFRYIE